MCQIFDAEVKNQLRNECSIKLRNECSIKHVTEITANTLERLVKKIDDVNAEQAPGCTRRASSSAGSCTSTAPGRTRLTNGAVFGKIAGASAANAA